MTFFKKNWKLILLFVVLPFIPIIVNILMSFSTPYTKGKIDDWIPFYGSFLGAIISVAGIFLVTRIQTDKQEKLIQDQIENNKEDVLSQITANEKKEHENRVIQQQYILSELLIELKDTQKKLKLICKLKENYAEDINPIHVKFQQFYQKSYIWNKLGTIYNPKLMSNILIFRKKYLDFCNNISLDTKESHKYNEYKRVLDELSVQNKQNTDKFRSTQEKLLELTMAIDQKQEAWKNFNYDDFGIDELITSVEIEINTIHQLIGKHAK